MRPDRCAHTLRRAHFSMKFESEDFAEFAEFFDDFKKKCAPDDG
jgi:hypothetical protein